MRQEKTAQLGASYFVSVANYCKHDHIKEEGMGGVGSTYGEKIYAAAVPETPASGVLL
jgi:hypothetical protein